MSFPVIKLPVLDTSTIMPEDDFLFIPYFNKTYDDIATCVNNKDNNFFQIPISDTPTDIPNLPNFGAYLVCVSGTDTSLPTITASLCKASSTANGSIATLGSQAGTGTWATFTLTITSTSTNFQIAHNNTGVTGNFNIRIVGTQ